ncbi:MAG: S-adenosyl-l-methionine hydroxide adenosyltransferase family protein [Planctomycetaceae bacterium]
MSSGIITLTTDFGLADSYVAQMKGVILGINPAAVIVDVTHQVEVQNIAAGSAILNEMIDAFPPDAIHVAVIDPGVGSDRALVAVETDQGRFVLPDNGLLSAIARRYPPGRIFRLTNRRFWRRTVSNTFHGRDILAPVAAHWSLGTSAAEFGEAQPSLVTLPLPTPTHDGERMTGEILHIDRFGNLVTSIEEAHLGGWSCEQLQVECNGQIVHGLKTHYAEVEPEALVALIGSSGRLEIALRNGNAARELNATVGARVQVRRHSP